jgi:hypothetical protein
LKKFELVDPFSGNILMDSQMLVLNWRAVLTKAWSIRLNILAVFLSGAEIAVQFLHGVLPVAPGLFAALAGVVSGAALMARIMVQKDLSND